MIDAPTRFEIQLLARLFESVLVLRNARRAYWCAVCGILQRYRLGEGLSTGFAVGAGDAEGMALSRMLRSLEHEGRITLAGKTRALTARLTSEREAQLLALAGMPRHWEVFEVLTALAKIRTSDGFHLIADHKDSKRDKREDRCQTVWTFYRVAIGVWHGWIDWKPSMQTGYVFARITDRGRETLQNRPTLPEGLPFDQEAADAFDAARRAAIAEFKNLTRGNSQNVGIIPAPYSFGELPNRTLARMIPDRSKA